MENPLPFFSEATHSALRIIQLRSLKLKHDLEAKARRETRHAFIVATGAGLLHASLLLGGYWLGESWRDAGWPAEKVAGALIVFLGFPGVFLLAFAVPRLLIARPPNVQPTHRGELDENLEQYFAK